MAVSPYEKFQNLGLILRDELAVDRTILANERTLLAYLRSGVALIIAGISIVNFSSYDHVWFLAMGVICIPGGLMAILIGLFRYRRMNIAISVIRKKLTPSQVKKESTEPKS
jgi:putative membrane protein